jgi:hypothetical protein
MDSSIGAVQEGVEMNFYQDTYLSVIVISLCLGIVLTYAVMILW